MKLITKKVIILLSIVCFFSTTQACQKTVEKLTVSTKIQNYLCGKFGLSSTGEIKVIGNYKLTQNSDLGKKSDEVIHLIQQDLFGDRLFWSCLLNVTQGKVQVLYLTSNPNDFGKIIEIKNK